MQIFEIWTQTPFCKMKLYIKKNYSPLKLDEKLKLFTSKMEIVTYKKKVCLTCINLQKKILPNLFLKTFFSRCMLIYDIYKLWQLISRYLWSINIKVVLYINSIFWKLYGVSTNSVRATPNRHVLQCIFHCTKWFWTPITIDHDLMTLDNIAMIMLFDL